MSEAENQARILLACGARPDVRLFRNTVGEGWQGDVAQRRGDSVLLRNARYVTFGLTPGSSDLIGWHALLIQPAHVGHVVGRFLAVEVKSADGRPSAEQRQWIEAVQKFGGCAGIARTPDDVVQLLRDSA